METIHSSHVVVVALTVSVTFFVTVAVWMAVTVTFWGYHSGQFWGAATLRVGRMMAVKTAAERDRVCMVKAVKCSNQVIEGRVLAAKAVHVQREEKCCERE